MTRKLSLNNKAFTLIELIVVISVIGILVLLAMPKFLGYADKAELTQIKNDVKTYETIIGAKLVQSDKTLDDWGIVSLDNMKSYASDRMLYDVKGKVSNVEFDSIEEGNYHKLSEDILKEGKTKLSGDFIASFGGKVYYHGGDVKGTDNGNDDEIYLATNDDFSWTKKSNGYIGLNEERGYFKYIGTGQEVVEIPHIIQGVEMKSYYRMFYQSGEDVKKVISTNDKVTDMSSMFSWSEASALDLSNFNTSNVINMNSMFSQSQVKLLDLGSFDTSNVTNMNSMFSLSQVKSLDLGSFDTSKVTNMNSMFSYFQATTLDLSSFDTGKVTDMSAMFGRAKLEKLDLSNFNTNSVTLMSNYRPMSYNENGSTPGGSGSGGIFGSAKIDSLTVGPEFTFKKSTNNAGLFHHATIKNHNLNFGTLSNNIKSVEIAFYQADLGSGLIDISGWDLSKVDDDGIRSILWDTKIKQLKVDSLQTKNRLLSTKGVPNTITITY